MVSSWQGEVTMSKPKMFGTKTGYVPNAKADMRHNKKVYQRQREKAFRDNDETVMAERQMKKEKGHGN
jgi:hypothetical protein